MRANETVTPLVVQVVMARDWRQAFWLCWGITFEAAAPDMGTEPPLVDLSMDRLPPWPQRRAICLRFGARCAGEYDLPELACAWAALAVDPAWPQDDEPAPERAKAFFPVFFALTDAIAEDPALLDDQAFARTVLGWRFMCDFGVAGVDPIVEAAALGARLEADKNELLRWARRWMKQ